MNDLQANQAQLEAIHSDSKNLLVLASAGSGKTRCLVKRVQRLIKEGVPSEEIVAVTLTTSAADEMRHRIGQKIGFTGTLHSFMLGLIQRHWKELGYARQKIGIIEENSERDLVRLIRVETGCRKADPHSDPIFESRYRDEMLRHSMLTYDMILTEGLRLIQLGVLAPINHLLVDEIQDANESDLFIYEMISTANRYWTGDFDQKIFSFRGAVDAMEYLGPDWQILRMETNYRCDKLICDAAQRLIEHNQNRMKKGMVSASLCEGEVSATQYLSEDEEKITVLQRLSLPGTHAVLLKSNCLVDEMVNYLESNGVTIARRELVARPADWKFAKISVGLLNDPDNDWFAYWFIREHHGEAKANAARLKALAAGKSLNETSLSIERDLPLNAYKSILKQCGVSTASLEIIETTIAALEPEATGTDLMERLSIDENQAQETAGVTVSTIHGAKGKEFHNVHLCAAEDEIMPRKSLKRDIEEERRIFFVAMTRARERLFITCCSERHHRGMFTAEPATPSRFISEAGIQLSFEHLADSSDDIPFDFPAAK